MRYSASKGGAPPVSRICAEAESAVVTHRPHARLGSRPVSQGELLRLLGNSAVLRNAFGQLFKADELAQLATVVRFMALQRGHQLYKKGYWYQSVVVVVDGRIEALHEGEHSQSLEVHGCGHWVGHTNFVDGLVNPAAAIHTCDTFATEYTELLHITQQGACALQKQKSPRRAVMNLLRIGTRVEQLTPFRHARQFP